MASELYVGLMSGTSIDGVDAALVDFSCSPWRTLARTHRPFSPALAAELNALQRSSDDELHRAAQAANALMDCCALAVGQILAEAGVASSAVAAIGVHGQTIRHRPDLGYTIQLANPSRLVEATGIGVVADFRSRDIAAGGQGAPLAPALHAALFLRPSQHRVVVNIGGIANITDLPPSGAVRGFDTGPGNTLLDAWCLRQTGEPFDRDGAWGASGRLDVGLLEALRADPYFAAPPPKSTGRDLFNLRWLERQRLDAGPPSDVQRTLMTLTVSTIVDAIDAYCAGVTEVLACGGGARNGALMRELAIALAAGKGRRKLDTTATYGVPVNDVEALAFAWLARETLQGRPGNLPAVTGARGSRILGAVYRA